MTKVRGCSDTDDKTGTCRRHVPRTIMSTSFASTPPISSAFNAACLASSVATSRPGANTRRERIPVLVARVHHSWTRQVVVVYDFHVVENLSS